MDAAVGNPPPARFFGPPGLARPEYAPPLMRVLIFPLVIVLCACGDDGESSSAGGAGDQGSSSSGAGDGKVRPAKNGMPMSEDGACQALHGALQSKREAFQGCVMTLRTCPSLVQVAVGGEQCLQYDQGTVQGCVAHYQGATDCDDLKKRNDECVFEAIAGSAPNGCP